MTETNEQIEKEVMKSRNRENGALHLGKTKLEKNDNSSRRKDDCFK